MQILEIRIHEGPAGDIKLDRNLIFVVNTQFFCHRHIVVFKGSDTVCRMDIQGNVHTPVVHFLHHGLRIREQLAVPGISGPALAVLRIDIHVVPAHIQNTYGNRHVLITEAVQQGHILILRIAVISAPPVAQSIPGKQRRGTAELKEHIQCLEIISSIAEEVHIGMPLRCGRYPAVILKYETLAVIDHSKTGFGKQTLTNRHLFTRHTPGLGFITLVNIVGITDGIIQRGCGAAKIIPLQQFLITIEPGTGLEQPRISHHLDLQSR